VLTQLVYKSVATERMPKSKLYKILVQARAKNKMAGITGLLVFVDGNFLQVLEGAPEAVAKLLKTISADPRHKDVSVIFEASVEQRTFPSWQMAYVSPSARELANWAGLRDTTTVESTLAALENQPSRLSTVLRELLGAIPADDMNAA
jgi:hypothetical protein